MAVHLLERRGLLSTRAAGIYATAVLAEPSLTNYLRVGDAASPVADSKGSLSGTVSGGTLGTTGLLVGDTNKAITIGSGQFVDFGDNRDFAGTVAFSVEFLIKPTSLAGSPVCAIGKWNDASSLGWLIAAQGTAIKFFRFNGSGQVTTGGDFTAGVTQHIAATYDGGTMRAYKNGAQVASISSGVSLPDTAQTLRVGANQTLGVLPAIYDEVALYSAALSPAVILDHYNKSIGL